VRVIFGSPEWRSRRPDINNKYSNY